MLTLPVRRISWLTIRCTRAGGDAGFEINITRARRVNFVVSWQSPTARVS